MSTRRPWITVASSVGLGAAGLLHAATTLTFQTSSLDLLPRERVYVQRLKQYMADFGELNDIVVAVEAPLERAKLFAARLAERIGPHQAARVTYRVDPERLGGRALLYLPEDRLAALRSSVIEHRRFLDDYAAVPSLARLVNGVNRELARAFAGHFVDLGLGEPLRIDPRFLDTLLAALTERLEGNAGTAGPWDALFLRATPGQDAGYFLSADRTLLFLLIEPRRQAGNFTDNRELIAGIRALIASERAQFPDVAAGVTGAAALSNDEMVTAFHDSAIATTLAIVLTLAAVLIAFRQAVKPLALSGALLVSLAWSFGIITLTVGHLSIFSVMFISLMVGLGIDYGIYLLFRYEEERRRGQRVHTALDVTAARTGPGVLFGALAAAGAFGVLMLTDFPGIQEFGFIGAVALLAGFLAMITLFPALLVLIDGKRPPPTPSPQPSEVETRATPLVLRRPWAIITGAVLVTAVAAAATPGARFDYSRLNLQARGTESVVWERKIVAAGQSAFPALASAASLAELGERQDAFRRLPTVSEVRSVLNVLPPRQDQKIAELRRLAPLVADIRVGPPPPLDAAGLRAALDTLEKWLALAVREAGPDAVPVTLRSAHARVTTLRETLAAGGSDLARRLGDAQAALRADFVSKLLWLQQHLDVAPMTPADLPEELRRQFVGRSDIFLLKVYPSIDTWTREGMRRFVTDLRSVDPAVTGAPVIGYEASRLMEHAYVSGTAYALLLATALAALLLGRLGATLLAVTPLVLGTLWTIGLMQLVGGSFNLANVWALPLIVGAGVEYGVNLVARHEEAIVHGGPSLARSTVMAVLLNGITTLTGFASLMVARHQGIWSLGLLLSVGAVATLAAALLVLPALLALARVRPVS
jgi:hopanoid biosynthesis associated RND transporter like protein HpnN